MQDNIYAQPLANVTDFSFDASVADVFPDMIQRSVPGYAAIITLLETLASRYAQAGSSLYDLGSSLGAATLALRRGIDAPDCRIIAIDNSEAMVSRCQKNIERDHHHTPVDVICGDLQTLEIENASIVVLNFTLQFIPIGERPALLKKIAAGIRPGGLLVLSEKLHFANEELDQRMSDMHHDFKRANGYTDLEIAQKRAAIENVLVPETLETHRTRLIDAGFSSAEPWFQCFNFSSILALK